MCDCVTRGSVSSGLAAVRAAAQEAVTLRFIRVPGTSKAAQTEPCGAGNIPPMTPAKPWTMPAGTATAIAGFSNNCSNEQQKHLLKACIISTMNPLAHSCQELVPRTEFGVGKRQTPQQTAHAHAFAGVHILRSILTGTEQILRSVLHA